MMDPVFLIIEPLECLVPGVNNFRMIELLCLDLCKVLVDLKVPVFKDLSLSKDSACQLTNALVPDCRVCDHVVSEVPHFCGILGEVIRETSIMAP